MKNIILKSSLTQISVNKATELTELCTYCINEGIGYEILDSYVFINSTDIPKLIEAGYLEEPEQNDPTSYQYGE